MERLEMELLVRYNTSLVRRVCWKRRGRKRRVSSKKKRSRSMITSGQSSHALMSRQHTPP